MTEHFIFSQHLLNLRVKALKNPNENCLRFPWVYNVRFDSKDHWNCELPFIYSLSGYEGDDVHFKLPKHMTIAVLENTLLLNAIFKNRNSVLSFVCLISVGFCNSLLKISNLNLYSQFVSLRIFKCSHSVDMVSCLIHIDCLNCRIYNGKILTLFFCSCCTELSITPCYWEMYIPFSIENFWNLLCRLVSYFYFIF